MPVHTMRALVSRMLGGQPGAGLVAANSAWLFAGELFSKGGALIATLAIAAHYGPALYGEFSFALSVALILAVFSDLGLSTLLTRDFTVSRRNLLPYLRLKSLLILGVLVVSLPYLVLSDAGTPMKLLLLLMLVYMLINGLHDFFRGLIRARQRMHIEAGYRSIHGLLLLLGVGYVLWNDGSFLWAAAIFPLTTLVMLIPLAIHSTSISTFSHERIAARELLVRAWPYAFTVALVFLFVRIDVIMLKFLRSSAEAGIYAAAQNFYLAATSLTLVFAALFPQLARDFHSDRSAFERKYLWYRRLSIISLIPVSALLAILIGSLIPAVLGGDYIDSAVPAAILMLNLPFLCLLSLTNYTMKATPHVSALPKFAFISLSLNIILNLALIPVWGATGAAITTVATTLLNLVLNELYLRRKVFT